MMIDARDAWGMLHNDRCLGVSTGRVQCFPRKDGSIECYVSDDSDETQVLSYDEFTERFKRCRFVALDTASV